ncbi:uncharacterized protein LOC129703107 [Leucoraja erinacea]|uniref:uncharacterized protein LOC129703107 n=1 Tax=Leucoraja erinaceus TaxID=7782 RepID=UPI002454AA96|nr:uncharacterized protein LOC129703107 [Leucoraja erinacea]
MHVFDCIVNKTATANIPILINQFYKQSGLNLDHVPIAELQTAEMILATKGKLIEHYDDCVAPLNSGTSCGGLRNAILHDFTQAEAKLELQILGLLGKYLTGPWIKRFHTSSQNQIKHVDGIKVVKEVTSNGSLLVIQTLAPGLNLNPVTGSLLFSAVLRAAATETVNGTVDGTVYLTGPATGVRGQVQSVEWKYSHGSTSRYVGKLIWDASISSSFPLYYSDRAHLYPNGSLALNHLQVNDSGAYSCIVTGQDGDEFTHIIIVNVFGNFAFGGNETEDNERKAKPDFNLSNHNKSNGSNGYTLVDCAYVGVFTGTAAALLVLVGLSIWTVVQSCRTRSSKQDGRNKTEQSDGIRRSTADDVYEKMGMVLR